VAKVQRRKSISVENRLYELIGERVIQLGLSRSEYVSRLVRVELISAGLTPPAANPSHRDNPGVSDLDQLDDEEPMQKTQVGTAPMKVVLPEHPQAPVEAGQDPKYLVALEFTRKKLKAGESVAPAPRKCYWCDELFKPGQTIESYDDYIVHERCKAQIVKMNGTQPDIDLNDGKRHYLCSVCGQPGHNINTCPDAPDE
jgi:hypothetical protein